MKQSKGSHGNSRCVFAGYPAGTPGVLASDRSGYSRVDPNAPMAGPELGAPIGITASGRPRLPETHSIVRETVVPTGSVNGLGAALADVTPAIRNDLQVFVALLTRWNPIIRLVSSHDIADLWARHIEDALQLAPLIPAGVTEAVDLGSGAGLPGLVLAIATGIHFDLIEADSRKAAFLREAATVTKAPVTIHARRIEETGLPPRLLVTARALAPLPRLLNLAKPLLAKDGICLFPKGERLEDEIAEAQRSWSFSLQRMPSRTSQSAGILRISDLSAPIGRTASINPPTPEAITIPGEAVIPTGTLRPSTDLRA